MASAVSADTAAAPGASDQELEEMLRIIQRIQERQQLKRSADLDGAVAGLPADGPESENALRTAGPSDKKAGKLLPLRHPNRDFFMCDIFDFSLKDDGATMEAPVFSLKTQKDLSVWRWESKDGTRSVEITPSVIGRATQFDKDILIYVISQMTEALNLNRPDAKNRSVRFRVSDYLAATNRSTRMGGGEYDRFQKGLDRLKGTTIKTNIKTGGASARKEGFGLIDRWTIIEKSPTDSRMVAVEITLSEWLFNAVQAREVLTIAPAYFRLRKPIERRLYELARKHCGNQPLFVIGEQLLKEKCGSVSSMREFRRTLREVIEADQFPEYRLHLIDEKNQVLFYSKDPLKLARAAATLTRHLGEAG